jgi:hypothetical protein
MITKLNQLLLEKYANLIAMETDYSFAVFNHLQI